MDIIIVENFLHVAEEISYKLLSFGIRGIPCVTRKEALLWLSQNPETDLALVDVDNKAVEGFKFIDEAHRERGGNIRFIIHSAVSIDKLAPRLEGKKIMGHILKPYDDHRVDGSLQIIFSNLNFPDSERRRHIRITPDMDDLLRLNFRLKGYSHTISGKIVDLSMGGVAVELLSPLNMELLPTGTYLPFLEFAINGHLISMDGIILLTRGKLLAIQYRSLKETDRLVLAKYIYKRMGSS